MSTAASTGSPNERRLRRREASPRMRTRKHRDEVVAQTKVRIYSHHRPLSHRMPDYNSLLFCLLRHEMLSSPAHNTITTLEVSIFVELFPTAQPARGILLTLIPKECCSSTVPQENSNCTCYIEVGKSELPEGIFQPTFSMIVPI